MNLTKETKQKAKFCLSPYHLINLSNEGKHKADKTTLINCNNLLELSKTVYKYYNTNKSIAIQFNRQILYIGTINFELQTGGTYGQQNTYLQLTITNFINKLLTKNNKQND
jgi:hypothetical protein